MPNIAPARLDQHEAPSRHLDFTTLLGRSIVQSDLDGLRIGKCEPAHDTASADEGRKSLALSGTPRRSAAASNLT